MTLPVPSSEQQDPEQFLSLSQEKRVFKFFPQSVGLPQGPEGGGLAALSPVA